MKTPLNALLVPGLDSLALMPPELDVNFSKKSGTTRGPNRGVEVIADLGEIVRESRLQQSRNVQ